MSTYRATLTATDGTTETLIVTQDEWDALVEQHEVPGTDKPAGLLERQAKDGTWKHAGEWGHRTESRKAERVDTTAKYREDAAALAAEHDRQDRRENRRSYYERTGR